MSGPAGAGSAFELLRSLAERPAPWSAYTTTQMWSDPHISTEMLRYHLDPEVSVASPPHDEVERAVVFLASRLPIARGTRVLDLGCGPGLYANRLAALGADVVGIDVSESSLDHAARSAPAEAAPELVLGDYLSMDLGRTFDVALLLMRDYCALGPDRRARLLRVVRRHLAPSGHFVFDVDSAHALRKATEYVRVGLDLAGRFWSPETYVAVEQHFVYPDSSCSLERCTIVEPARTRTFANWVQYFSPGTLRAELRHHGFEVEEVWGDLTGGAYDDDADAFAVLARCDESQADRRASWR